jgi:hypothetical protein
MIHTTAINEYYMKYNAYKSAFQQAMIAQQ